MASRMQSSLRYVPRLVEEALAEPMAFDLGDGMVACPIGLLLGEHHE